jgi:tRNA G10  N-methylase Trm11
MTMKKITIDELKALAKQYDLHVCRIKGSEVVQIRKNPSDKYEDISWEEFEAALQEKDLAVYKAENSDFLKIMKDRD